MEWVFRFSEIKKYGSRYKSKEGSLARIIWRFSTDRRLTHIDSVRTKKWQDLHFWKTSQLAFSLPSFIHPPLWVYKKLNYSWKERTFPNQTLQHLVTSLPHHRPFFLFSPRITQLLSLPCKSFDETGKKGDGQGPVWWAVTWTFRQPFLCLPSIRKSCYFILLNHNSRGARKFSSNEKDSHRNLGSIFRCTHHHLNPGLGLAPETRMVRRRERRQ